MTNGDRPSFLASFGDRIVAVAAALLTLNVYLLTIYPGLFGVGDAAKFAFVGKVLGIPHAPGYPLYVAVSHLFSYVPLGTLAYRMNVLSALLAAAAVAVVYGAGRVLGLERAVAVSAALALGFGHAFWSKALYAKGYTLNAALVATGLLVLLTWGRTRRTWHLYAAIAVFALSIGNHLIVIALLPALIIYVLLTDWRLALSPRTLLVTTGLVVLGLSQYLLILVRTRQNAPYLEARASNLSELVDVMLARRWAHEIGAYQVGDLLAARLPLVSKLVLTELTIAGLLLAGVGVLALARRRPREAALLFLSAVGIVGLTANMSSNEDEGFLLAAFVALWLLAGAGLQWLFVVLRHAWTRGGFRPAAVVSAATLLAAVALPGQSAGWQLPRQRSSQADVRDPLLQLAVPHAARPECDRRRSLHHQHDAELQAARRGRRRGAGRPDHGAVIRQRQRQGAARLSRLRVWRRARAAGAARLLVRAGAAVRHGAAGVSRRHRPAMDGGAGGDPGRRRGVAGERGRVGAARGLPRGAVRAEGRRTAGDRRRGRRADGAALEAVGFPSRERRRGCGRGHRRDRRARRLQRLRYQPNREQAVVSVNGVERARTAAAPPSCSSIRAAGSSPTTWTRRGDCACRST